MLRKELETSRLWIPFSLVALVGAGAASLVWKGNPGNMGICGACFLRDTAGSLGLFAAPGPRIFRPEVTGLLVGALSWNLIRRRFAARSGSFAVTRFFFGVWMGIGALVFLGCPFRMLQRIAGGDLTAWIAALGLVGGVGVGLAFERRGYNVGRTAVAPAPVGLLGPITGVGLLVLFLIGNVLVGPGPADAQAAPAHAPWIMALLVTLGAGAILSGTGFCVVSAARQVFKGPRRMLIAVLVLMGAYSLVSMAAGNFRFGMDGQPAAHSDHLWSVLAMALVGLCGVICGGCPVRQIIMSGEGNGDAFMTCMGLLVGGAVAHNLGLASSGAGTTPAGRTAVIVGLVLSLIYAASIVSTARSSSPGSAPRS